MVSVLTGVSEAVNAGLSPVKFSKVSKTAPLNVIKRKNLIDAVASGIVYGNGTGENTAYDYAKNIGRSIIGNYTGYKLVNYLYGGGDSRPIARAVMSGLSDKTVSSIYDKILKNKK